MLELVERPAPIAPGDPWNPKACTNSSALLQAVQRAKLRRSDEALLLAIYTRLHYRLGVCFAGARQLGEDIGVQRKETVSRSLARLRANGWIQQRRRGPRAALLCFAWREDFEPALRVAAAPLDLEQLARDLPAALSRRKKEAQHDGRLHLPDTGGRPHAVPRAQDAGPHSAARVAAPLADAALMRPRKELTVSTTQAVEELTGSVNSRPRGELTHPVNSFSRNTLVSLGLMSSDRPRASARVGEKTERSEDVSNIGRRARFARLAGHNGDRVAQSQAPPRCARHSDSAPAINPYSDDQRRRVADVCAAYTGKNDPQFAALILYQAQSARTLAELIEFLHSIGRRAGSNGYFLTAAGGRFKNREQAGAGLPDHRKGSRCVPQLGLFKPE